MSVACLLRRVALTAVASSACQPSSALTGPPPPGPAAPGATPRLVPWTVEADGLPPVQRGLLDRQEDLHCRFVHAADDRLRCLPVNAELHDSQVFADPTCTEHVFLAERTIWNVAAFEGPVTMPLPRLGCEPQRFEVRAMRRIADDGPRFQRDGTSCVPAATAPDSLPAYFSLVVGSVVPPERWAAGEEADGARLTDRLRVRDVVTADGTRVGDHLVDDRWNKTCVLEGDGCWPPALNQHSELYTDAACSAGNELFFADPCQAPVLIGGYSRDRVFAVGPRWNGPMFRGTKGCFPEGETSRANAPFTKGPPLDPDAVALARLEPIGSGRLRAYGLHGSQGEAVPLAGTLLSYPRIYDSEAGEDCMPVRTRAGEIRCLPVSVQSATAFDFGTFADPECTQPAFICNTGPSCAGRDVVRMKRDATGNLVDAELSTGRDLPAGSVYGRGTGACLPFLPGLYGLATWGDEAPWDKYAQLRERNGVRREAP